MNIEEKKHQVNRDGWKSGPWDGEPDRLEWRHSGLPCLIVRNQMGAWCGYVAVDPTHPAYKRGDDINVEVHGGLTYGDHCQGPICHVPLEGESDLVWWLGFDCSHCFDLTPSTLKYNLAPMANEIYRDQAYVTAEVNRLAEQLAAMPKASA